MRRLFYPELQPGEQTIGGPEAHHGRDVLRLRQGDTVELFDGRGHSASAVVERVTRSELVLRADQPVATQDVKPPIILASAIPKFAHQETLVRMATEIGLAVFAPIIFERSSVREQFRPEKWQRWTIEACKQSRRNFLPEIREPVDFEKLIQKVEPGDLIFFGATDVPTESDWQGRLKEARNVLIVVGPEGGFTAREIDLFHQIDSQPIRIGPNILRIETAALAIGSVVMFLSGRSR